MLIDSVWYLNVLQWTTVRCVARHQMALIGASRELALQFWHQNRTQPHMEHSICQNYLQCSEISAVCMFQRCLMEEVINCAICNNVGKLQRPFLDHARHENATHFMQVKRKSGCYLLNCWIIIIFLHFFQQSEFSWGFLKTFCPHRQILICSSLECLSLISRL